MCRSRRELSNENLLAIFGFNTAENEPCKVCPLSAHRSPRSIVWALNKCQTPYPEFMLAFKTFAMQKQMAGFSSQDLANILCAFVNQGEEDEESAIAFWHKKMIRVLIELL